ncbi:phage/plasmid replication protein, gene II/X family [Pseudomonas aeruginosa]|nr:phage/plasmid replication protein, gene II/X family [Pseudomonas aeruginosa]
MHRWLERRNLPTNLWELCDYQEALRDQERCFIQECWRAVTAELFAAFEGMTMKRIDDDKVLAALIEKYTKVGKGRWTKARRQATGAIIPAVFVPGKPSDAYARNLFRTYRSLKDYGWEETMASMNRASFYNHVRDLQAAGISKAMLQNLSEYDNTRNVVPILRLLEVDFSAQSPTGTSSRPWRPRDARADSRSPRAARRCRNPHSRPGRVGAQRWIRRPISTFVSTWSRTFPACSMTSTWCARSWTWSCAESSRNRPQRPFAGSASTETSRRSGAAGA